MIIARIRADSRIVFRAGHNAAPATAPNTRMIAAAAAAIKPVLVFQWVDAATGIDEVCGADFPSARTASWISMRASAISCSRCFASFSKQRWSRRRIVNGAASGRAVQSGSRSRIATIASDTVSPTNAWRPVSISYNIQPNAQISVRLSTGRPRACSGLM